MAHSGRGAIAHHLQVSNPSTIYFFYPEEGGFILRVKPNFNSIKEFIEMVVYIECIIKL